MVEGSQWRARLADRVVQAYAQNPHIDSIILGGSTARRHADRYSDIEIGIFWHQPPADLERDAMAQATGGDVVRIYPYDPQEQVWCDDLMVGRDASDTPKSGLLVEIAHATTGSVDQVLEDVLRLYDPDPGKQNLISGILDGIPLRSSSKLGQWREWAGNYPDGLVEAVIRRHAQIDHYWRWKMWLERGPNLMMLNKQLVAVEEKMLHVLLGLNRVYFFGFKWLDVVIDRMQIAPQNLGERLTRVHLLPPEEGVDLLAEIVEDVYSLIEENFPKIEVEWFRRVFRYQRPIWDQPPDHIERGD